MLNALDQTEACRFAMDALTECVKRKNKIDLRMRYEIK